MNKKAIHMTEIAVIIVAAVVLILLIFMVNAIGKGLNTEASDEICRESIILHSKITDATRGIVDTGLECTANHHEIAVNNKEELYIHVIEQLKKCWYKTLGKENRLSKNPRALGLLGTSEANYLFVCSSFEIFEKGQIDDDVSTLEISRYMNKVDPRTNKPYISYFDTNWGGNNNLQFFIMPTSLSKDKVRIDYLEEFKLSKKDDRKKYLVVFLSYDKGDWTDDVEFDTKLFDIRNTDGMTYHTFVIPQDKVVDLKPENFYWQTS